MTIKQARYNFQIPPTAFLLLVAFIAIWGTTSYAWAQGGAEVAVAAKETPLRLTLEEAISVALKKSPLLASSRNDVSAYKHRAKAAKGALLPRVDAYSTYRRLSDPAAVVPIKNFGGTPPTFSRDQYSAGITVKVPIYQGGRLWTGLDMARLSKAIAQERFRLTRQELIYNVTNVFNQILFLQDLVDAQEETLTALKRLREDSSRRLKVGRLAPVDLMRIDTQVAEQEYALARSKQEKVRAIETLVQLLGLESEQGVQVEGDLKKPDTKGVIFVRQELDELILKRPDVQNAQKEVARAEKAVRLEKGFHLPSVNLVGDYGRRAGSGFEGDEEVWSAGVSFELNLFSGGVISSRVKEAEAKYLAAKNRYKNLRLIAFKEAVHALSAIKEAERRLQAAKRALETAKESFRIEELRYKTGAGTVTDSLLSHSAWLQARANVFQALFDMEKAVMDYRLATGTIESEFISDRKGP